MPTPSLLIVPARFKTGKLYSQIPTSGAGDFTVTRNTEARRFNSAGLIESVASGIPRLDYYTSGGVTGCPALLVEPAATNLAFNSQTWATANNWSLTETTIVTGAIAAPDGAMTANAISPTAASGNHRFFSNSATAISFVSGTIYTQSAFFKKGTGTAGRYIQLLAAPGPFGGLGFANYDLELGTVSASGGTLVGASIQNFGNGWYRCICTQTATASGSAGGVFASLIPASGSARIPNMTTSSGDVLYGWGAQLETGSVATSYIPTTAGTGSRSADVISVSGAVSGSIGQTEGTIYAEVDIRNMVKETYLIRIDDGATANVITLRTLTSNVIRTGITATTSGTVNISSAAFTAGIVKIAFAYKSGEIALSVNGATALTANGTFVFGASLNRITLGSNVSGGELNDRIRAAALYTTRLTDAELATLTTP